MLRHAMITFFPGQITMTKIGAFYILYFSTSCWESEMGKPKTIVPRNSTDRMLFTLMVVGIPLGVAWLGGVIMPHYHHTFDSTVLVHIVCATFILYNIFHNMLMVIKIDASGRTSYLPSVLKTGIFA